MPPRARSPVTDVPPTLRDALRDRYVVEEEVGEGGMATVYRARDVRHDRTVALKVLKPEVARAVGVERFLQEIRAAARLQHPHILPLFDSGEAGGFLFYVMPCVEGPSLRDRLDDEGPLPVEEAVRMAYEVADALEHAHRKGIVHRDIKPANILFQEGRALVADFGIARSVDVEDGGRMTGTGITLGTPRYMSPEQATGESRIDHRTDLWSLGCVLYEALAGRPPFDGPTAMAVLAHLLTEAPPPVGRDRPRAAAVEPVLARALQRLPADRFATAGEMAEALSALSGAATVGGATASAPPPVAPAGAGPRWAKAAVAVLLVTVAGGLLLPWDRGGGPSGSGSAQIVVLPFRPVGEGVDEIASGITLTTRDRLAVLEGIEVIGGVTSSARDFADLAAPAIAGRVGADYVLRATVERSGDGDRIEVRPRLYGSNGVQIDFWEGEPIVVRATNLSELEATIARDVARALDLTVGAAARADLPPPQRSPAAYEVYLRGVSSSDESREARLREAVALDSTFAPAHAELGMSMLNSRDPEDIADFREHAEAALRHGPRFYGSHLAMGLYHRTVTRDADSALVYLDRARELAPGNADVMHFLASGLWLRGRLDSALVVAQRGAGLDRLNPSAVSRVSRILLWQHALDEAWQRHLEVRPHAVRGRFGFVLADGALIQVAMGRPDSARGLVSAIPDEEARLRTADWLVDDLMGWLVPEALLDRLCREPDLDPGNDPHRSVGCGLEAWLRGEEARAREIAGRARAAFRDLLEARPRDENFRMRLAYAHFLTGERDAALAQADSALALVDSYWDYYPGAANALAWVRLAGLAGDAGRAVPRLRTMLEGHGPLTPAWLRNDPAFDPIRGDPGFRALVEGG